jgi:hypothetical protein
MIQMFGHLPVLPLGEDKSPANIPSEQGDRRSQCDAGKPTALPPYCSRHAITTLNETAVDSIRYDMSDGLGHGRMRDSFAFDALTSDPR